MHSSTDGLHPFSNEVATTNPPNGTKKLIAKITDKKHQKEKKLQMVGNSGVEMGSSKMINRFFILCKAVDRIEYLEYKQSIAENSHSF